MPDLFNSPVLLMEQPSAQLDYKITDPQGVPLAYVTQVAGDRPKTGIAGLFADPVRSRVAVQVAGPDGSPLFFVDRADQTPRAMHPPCAVVAPDGQLIGHVDEDMPAKMARMARTGGRVAVGGPKGTEMYDQTRRLLDAQQQPLCQIAWEPTKTRTMSSDAVNPSYYREGGRYAVFMDMNGTQIAYLDISASNRKSDRFTLQIGYQLPEPLRTLVIAAPLAMDLMEI
jgi:hypothetical protein